MCSPLGFHLIIITQQTFPCLDRMPRVCSSTAPAMLHSTCQQFQRKPHDSPNCEPGPSSKTHYPDACSGCSIAASSDFLEKSRVYVLYDKRKTGKLRSRTTA